MHKAVFLDRDGVINEDGGRLREAADLRLLPGVGVAIKALNERGYRVIVVTNQAGIAKGFSSLKNLHNVHRAMNERLAEEGARLDGIYYCPHHPQGTVAEYMRTCNCRKPGTGMIEQASDDLGIDLSKSFLIGDRLTDIMAGERAGLTTILVKTGYAAGDPHRAGVPDFVAEDLPSAITYIS